MLRPSMGEPLSKKGVRARAARVEMALGSELPVRSLPAKVLSRPLGHSARRMMSARFLADDESDKR